MRDCDSRHGKGRIKSWPGTIEVIVEEHQYELCMVGFAFLAECSSSDLMCFSSTRFIWLWQCECNINDTKCKINFYVVWALFLASLFKMASISLCRYLVLLPQWAFISLRKPQKVGASQVAMLASVGQVQVKVGFGFGIPVVWVYMQLNIHCVPISMNTLSALLITHEETILQHSEGKNVSVVSGSSLLWRNKISF